MRGEIRMERDVKENMDVGAKKCTCTGTTDTATKDGELKLACDIHRATGDSSSIEKECFGFTCENKDERHWQTFGNVPDRDGAAILDKIEENDDDGEIRFVHGFQFAAAAQQMRIGCKEMDSDSEHDSDISNLEINSNLSALSDLSVSNESLNSVSIRDTSLEDVTRVRQPARVRANSDGESTSVSGLRGRTQLHVRVHQHGHDYGHNSCASKPSPQRTSNNTSSHLEQCLESYHAPACTKSEATATSQCRIQNGELCHAQTLHVNQKLERNVRRLPTRNRSGGKSRTRGEHYVRAGTAGDRGSGSCGNDDVLARAKSALVLKKCEKSWTISGMENVQEKCGSVQKRKLDGSKAEGNFVVVNGRRRKRKKKKGKGKIDAPVDAECDFNGNYSRRTMNVESSWLNPKKTSHECRKSKKRKHHSGDPKKVRELKRKLEAISSELARLQKLTVKRGVKRKAGGHLREERGPKSRTSASTSTITESMSRSKTMKRGRIQVKRTKPQIALAKNATFKMSNVFLLPPTLVAGNGDLRPACSMVIPRGLHPPKSHPIWKWKLGGTPLPKPHRQKVISIGAIQDR